ncbi:MAG: DUF3891 family protein [Actinobacteria bacterium]|nr:DUF3891 family protein [Actinomycetota bacterium]
MLVTKRGDGFRLVTQYEHGALAGELAERWGNDRFAAPPEPLASALTIAAAHHDDGWRELDDLPAYNPEAGRPAHFLELPLERTAPPYGRGVDSVYARDQLAGALVHAHWTGLYSGRWGLQSSAGPVRRPLAEEVVAKGEPRRQAVLREAWGFKGLRSEFEAHAWHAYEVLQALDVTSLALSLLDPVRPTDPAVEPAALTATLFQVEQQPGARILPSVPTAPLGEHLDLRLTIPEPGVAAFDPWPFAGDGFALVLPSRWLSEDGLGEEEARAAYRAAPVEPIRWELRPG